MWNLRHKVQRRPTPAQSTALVIVHVSLGHGQVSSRSLLRQGLLGCLLGVGLTGEVLELLADVLSRRCRRRFPQSGRLTSRHRVRRGGVVPDRVLRRHDTDGVLP